ncbi:hypothetical protein [Streptomyces sp. NPDC001389]|uniref:hypothetical protein n=1 Tax=Streptomyces sp. NPDC001389 TaxID=3364569 RepID=UPI0036757A60
MMTSAPDPSVLLDHRGAPRPRMETSLDYEHARLGLAFHEAGHAVLSMAYGFHVLASQVIAWEPEPGRYTVTGNTSFQVQGQIPVWRFAAQAAAGQAAQVRYLMAYGLWTPDRAAACAADHDREHAIDVLDGLGVRLGRDHVPVGGKSWAMVRGVASRKIGYLWREIRTVAHAMAEHDKLTGDEIAALTGLTNPAIDSLTGGAA